MVILYKVKNGCYVNLEDTFKEKEGTFNDNVYVNLTNKCSCACTFCLRNTKEMQKTNSLWLKREATVDEIKAEFDKYELSQFNEIIFCGFGEPTMRLDDLLEVAKYLKARDPKVKIRINTNGLANLVHKKQVPPLFKGLIDTISISLNAPTAEEYLELTRNNYGLESFNEMLNFSKDCKNYVPNVVLTVVDCISKEKIAKSQAICDKIGVPLRVRPFE